MKPRTKARIEKEIKRHERILAEEIKASIDAEARSLDDIKEQEELLKELRAEPCFENTFEGKVEKLEKTAFAKIEGIIEELSSVTGKDYLLQEALTEIYKDREGKR